MTLLPSIFAAIFNLFYNRQQIIRYLQGAERTFDLIQAVINAIAFPLGISLTIYLAQRAVSQLQAAGRRRAVRREDVRYCGWGTRWGDWLFPCG